LSGKISTLPMEHIPFYVLVASVEGRYKERIAAMRRVVSITCLASWLVMPLPSSFFLR
jgi:hypothetical protein